jgi:hypothetical protein
MKTLPVLQSVGCLSLLALSTAAYAGGGGAPVDPCSIIGRQRLGMSAETPTVPECPVRPPEREPEPDLNPPAFSRTRDVQDTIVIDRPGDWNFLNELLVWADGRACDPRAEQKPVLKVTASNVTIRDVGVSAAGGIEVTGVNVRFENVTVWSCKHGLKVAERAGRVFVNNSRFYGDEGARSKEGALRIDSGNVAVSNSLFVNAQACVTLKPGTDVSVEGSDFVGCREGVKADSQKASLIYLATENNRFWHGETYLRLIGAVRATSTADKVFDGKYSKVEKDAHLVVKP